LPAVKSESALAVGTARRSSGAADPVRLFTFLIGWSEAKRLIKPSSPLVAGKLGLCANHYLLLYREMISHWRISIASTKLYFFNESILKVENSERELLNNVKYDKLIMVLMLEMTLETFNIPTVQIIFFSLQ
jgi:hypothetical protein